MVKYLFLIFGYFFLVASCAMQGSINGGPTDKNAPYIISEKSEPMPGTVNFKASEIKLKFNEFYRLNEPNTSMFIVPPSVKLIPIAKDRELLIKLDGQLKDSTTYAIYFNKSIKDIHEGNDSLLSYVFSTGSYIDSLTYTGKVIDAFNRTPAAKLTLSLIPDTATTFSQKALYFCMSDVNGVFKFKYIKPGSYKLVAFADGNNDLIPQSFEYSGFKSAPIRIFTNVNDSIPLIAFPSKPKGSMRSSLFQGPGYFTISANHNLKTANFYHEGKTFTPSFIHHSNDSISFYHSPAEKDTFQLIVSHDSKSDTLNIKTYEKERKKQPKLFPLLKTAWGQPIDFSFSDELVAILKDSVKVFANDSIPVEGVFKVVDGKLRFTYSWKEGWKTIGFKFLTSSLVFKNYKEKFKTETNVPIFDEKEVGTLKFVTKDLKPGSYIELLKEGKVIGRHAIVSNEKEHVFDYLEKGNYGIRWIDDSNSNGLWDTGDLATKQQPEEVKLFSDIIVVRPNWEIEIVLSIDKWR
jgi:hypothetical protein